MQHHQALDILCIQLQLLQTSASAFPQRNRMNIALKEQLLRFLIARLDRDTCAALQYSFHGTGICNITKEKLCGIGF